jgi:hypothetical protein
MDKSFELKLRPPWVELIRLNGPDEMDLYSRRVFYSKEADIRSKNADPAFKLDRSEFVRAFGVNLENYQGYFAEVGGTDTIQGPVIPVNKIRPVFSLRMSNTGKSYTVHAKTMPGFLSKDQRVAWVKVGIYEEILGDDFFDKLKEQAEKIEEARKVRAQKGLEAPPSQPSRKIEVRDWAKKPEQD